MTGFRGGLGGFNWCASPFFGLSLGGRFSPAFITTSLPTGSDYSIAAARDRYGPG